MEKFLERIAKHLEIALGWSVMHAAAEGMFICVTPKGVIFVEWSDRELVHDYRTEQGKIDAKVRCKHSQLNDILPGSIFFITKHKKDGYVLNYYASDRTFSGGYTFHDINRLSEVLFWAKEQVYKEPQAYVDDRKRIAEYNFRLANASELEWAVRNSLALLNFRVNRPKYDRAIELLERSLEHDPSSEAS